MECEDYERDVDRVEREVVRSSARPARETNHGWMDGMTRQKKNWR